MFRVPCLKLIALLVLSGAPHLHAQRIHKVRVLQASADLFRFEPARVNAHPGDVLEFIVESGGPYVIGFEPKDLPEADRMLLDEAIPGRSALLRGPVLAGKGSRLRITLPAMAKGAYRFVSVTHLAYRMGGVLVIQ
jgi:plastocyanin